MCGWIFLFFFSTKGYLIEAAPKFLHQNSTGTSKLAPGSCSVSKYSSTVRALELRKGICSFQIYLILADTGLPPLHKHLEIIYLDLLMDREGENSEIWDQSHCFGFMQQNHQSLYKLTPVTLCVCSSLPLTLKRRRILTVCTVNFPTGIYKHCFDIFLYIYVTDMNEEAFLFFSQFWMVNTRKVIIFFNLERWRLYSGKNMSESAKKFCIKPGFAELSDLFMIKKERETEWKVYYTTFAGKNKK